MKKLFFLLLSVVIINNSFAQHEGSKVNFKDIDLETAIKMAKEKNLLVFCNFSTSWCGPCKQLFAEVYSDAEVGEMMNKTFISLYIDAEAKEWAEVAKKFKVTGYPTMILLDGAGKERARIVGALPKVKFMEEIEKNLDNTRTPEGLKKRYEAGERTPQLIYDYGYLTMKSGNEKKGYEIINGYFNSLSDQQKISKENWFLFTIFTNDLKDEKAQYLINHSSNFYPTISKKVVDDIVYKLLRLDIAGYMSGYRNRNNLFNQVDFDKTVAMINKVELDKKSQLLSTVKVAKARIKCETTKGDDFSSFMKVCKEEFENLSEVDCSIMVGNFASMSLVASDKVKLDAIALIEKFRETYKPTFEKGFDTLSKAIESLKPVERGEAIAFKAISFDEAVKLAEKEGKLVFIDCFTDWCGPCKVLAAEVFTAKVVKDYFNKNFINIKIDMEKGEGPALAKRFKIKGYPTLLLVDGKGMIVHEKVGSDTVEPFLNEFKKANVMYHSK